MITDRERQILHWIEENPLISQQELADLAGITRSSAAVHISNLTKKGLIQGKGYILQKKPYIVVIGGVNMDICGRPYQPLVMRDSNPGTTFLSAGGVGRNIAHNLALLDEDVKLITAFGSDGYASQLSEECHRIGIDTSQSFTIPNGVTSTYLFITDEHGDMELAVSDMGIYEHLTPELMATRIDFINRASLCICDTNLPQNTLEYLAAHCQCPLFADTVSTTKAKKLKGLLGKIHTLKPNLIEAEELTGIKIADENSLRAAAECFLKQGMQQVFISLGEEGVYAANNHEHLHLPSFPCEIVNTTGAGDSFVAALAWAWRQQLPLRDIARAGMASASICIASESTISPHISCEHILEILDQHPVK